MGREIGLCCVIDEFNNQSGRKRREPCDRMSVVAGFPRGRNEMSGNASVETAFIAYPSEPHAIGQLIESAKTKLNQDLRYAFRTWKDTDNWGDHLIYPLLEDIERSERFFADITRVNFNVIFEIGYAIAKGKRPLLLINGGINNDRSIYERAGIFDTIGFKEYQNSDDLSSIFSSAEVKKTFKTSMPIDRRQPIYVILEPTASETSARLISRIKKSRIRYRSFDPNEDFRLSVITAVEATSQSLAAVVTLLSEEDKGYQEHNIRSCFIAGVAFGLGKRLFIAQSIDGPDYLDIKDMLIRYRAPDDLNEKIDELLFEVHNDRHEVRAPSSSAEPILSRLRLGDHLAENEMLSLEEYFLETDAYYRLLRGELNLVVGRKGTGKTALWVRIRDKIRINRRNVVVDLKPEGYQLVKLKEEVLSFLSEGARLHLITAFWEYLIYMEIAYKLLEKDEERHRRDNSIYHKYLDLEVDYRKLDSGSGGDFSERVRALAAALGTEFRAQISVGNDKKVVLNNDQVTNLLRSGILQSLKKKVKSYLQSKQDLWVLFDNIDKGWAAFGLEKEDVFILRCLVEASRKIQRELRSEDNFVQCVVFLRNDIYQLLMQENPDFGKESRVTLDWSHQETLRELLLRRLAFGLSVPNSEIDHKVGEIIVAEHNGRDALSHLMQLSMMRPRNLIRLFSLCRSYAVNLRHARIETSDIDAATVEFSDDILSDIGNELRDVDSTAHNVLYGFIGEKARYLPNEARLVLEAAGFGPSDTERVFDYLLYYGVFGVETPEGDRYIYDLGYDMHKVRAWLAKPSARAVMHPALYPALGIRDL